MTTTIKICGVTTPADAVAAADLGVEFIGLNFYPQSPRCVTQDQARQLVRQFWTKANPCGVFVTNDWEMIESLTLDLGLQVVQTYSDAPPPKSFMPAAKYMPAFRVQDAADLDHIKKFVAACRPTAVLVDSFVAGEMGGTGHRAPWELLVGFDPGVPLILAGGLTPDNVADAIRLVRPWGVDVASGVESAPGVKDHGKLRAFVQAARGALE